MATCLRELREEANCDVRGLAVGVSRGADPHRWVRRIEQLEATGRLTLWSLHHLQTVRRWFERRLGRNVSLEEVAGMGRLGGRIK